MPENVCATATPPSPVTATRPFAPPFSVAVRLLLGLLAIMGLLPLLAGDYVLALLIVMLLQAYLGLAWNIMMGFAGQFSLGHALYIGLGAYGAGVLYGHYAVSPWIGMLVGMALSVLAGALIASLGFRFRVMGVYFALLTIAFAEFTRILFDHWDWVGASSGLYLPVTHHSGNTLWELRGSTTLFYYVILALTIAAFALSHHLLHRRIGIFWRAIRENEDAAETLGINVFRYKMAAVAVSAAMTAPAGTFIAFYNNTLYPESLFSMHRSIELMLGVIIGGIGTLFGPVFGAVVLTLLGEGLTVISEHLGIDGIKQLFYGIGLLLIVLFRPAGLWPALSRRLGGGGDS